MPPETQSVRPPGQAEYIRRFAHATAQTLLHKRAKADELDRECTFVTDLVDQHVDDIVTEMRHELALELTDARQWFAHAEPPSPLGSTPTRTRKIYLTVIP